MATGFVHENGAWQQARLEANNKFVMRPATQRDRDLLAALFDPHADQAKWIVMKLGDSVPVAGCSGCVFRTIVTADSGRT